MCKPNANSNSSAAPSEPTPSAPALSRTLANKPQRRRQPPQHQQHHPHQQPGADDVAAGHHKAFEPYHSRSVPKSENLESGSKSGDVTTVMLRNIPNKYSQCTLMDEIDEMGFAGTYDFFYLPMDVQNRSNVGYAFIDFVKPADAHRFLTVFKEHRFRKHQSRKISSVSCAHVQGLDANLRHFENRAVTHARNDQYRPVVILQGERVDFDRAVAAAVARGDPSRRTPTLQPAPVAAPPPAASVAATQSAPLEAAAVFSSDARADFELALREYVRCRQASAAASTTCTSLACSMAPPPGLEDAEQGHASWLRQASAPASFIGAAPFFHSPPGSDSGSWTPPSVDGAFAPPCGTWQRALSVDAEPWSTVQPKDAPLYLPLPSIPSVSKIFAGCHMEEDEVDPLVRTVGNMVEVGGVGMMV